MTGEPEQVSGRAAGVGKQEENRKTPPPSNRPSNSEREVGRQTLPLQRAIGETVPRARQ